MNADVVAHNQYMTWVTCGPHILLIVIGEYFRSHNLLCISFLLVLVTLVLGESNRIRLVYQTHMVFVH